MVRPFLRDTYFPDGAAFQSVPRAWPSDAELCGQYMVLTRRVRACAEAAVAARDTGDVAGGGMSPRLQGPPAEIISRALTWFAPRGGVYVVDASLVAATVDSEPWFSVGRGEAAFCAWGAARVHHRCALSSSHYSRD